MNRTTPPQTPETTPDPAPIREAVPRIPHRVYLAPPGAADGDASDAAAGEALPWRPEVSDDPDDVEPDLCRARMELLGRLVTVYREPYATAEDLAEAALSDDGKAVYAAGWGGWIAEPSGPGRLLLVSPAVPAEWHTVTDVAASAALTDADGKAVAVLRKLVLCGRWVKVAVPAGALIPKRWRGNWFDNACTTALLNPAALDLWRASPR